jgi:hypothetical protein
MKNLVCWAYKALDRWRSRSTVDQSRGGGQSLQEMGCLADSGAQALPRQCEKEEKAVGSLTMTGVGRRRDRVKPAMKGRVAGAWSLTCGAMGR